MSRMKADRGCRWGPDSQHPGVFAGWIAEAVPVTTRGGTNIDPGSSVTWLAITEHLQPSGQDVDGLIKLIMGMGNRAGEHEPGW